MAPLFRSSLLGVLIAGYNFGLTSESPDGAGVVGRSFAF